MSPRLLILMFLLSLDVSTGQFYNFSCNLGAPERDSKFPVIKLDELELQTSHRVSHQLVTRIFAIFLKEIYGFANVSIKTHPETISNGKSEKLDEFREVDQLRDANEAAVNLEVWVTPDSHIAFSGANQAASLSQDLARYGLFIPDFLGKKIYSYADFISNSSNYQEVIKQFRASEVDFRLIRNLETNESMYRPSRCISVSEPCAIVLTSHYKDMRFFKKHIDLFQLRMEIHFLGDKLPKVLKRLQSVHLSSTLNPKVTNSKFLVLHWTPSEIINGDINFLPLEMPKCELYKSSMTGCRYNPIPVTVYFNDFAKDSKELRKVLEDKFEFESIIPILKLYRTYQDKIDNILIDKSIQKNGFGQENRIENIYNEVACKWLHQNKDDYNSWIYIPHDSSISIAGMFPPQGTGREYDGIQSAVKLATQFIGMNPNILPNHKLKITFTTPECKPDIVMRQFVEFYSQRDRLVGVLGPSCSEAVEGIAAISKHFKMAVVTYAAEGISFKDRDEFPYFFRTIGETKQYEIVYEMIFAQFGWKRFAALTEDGFKYTEYLSNMESSMKEKNIELIVNRKFKRDNDIERQFTKFKVVLKELKSVRAKIIILDVHDHILMKSIMCAASKLQMTAKTGYVWFLPVYMSMKINDTGLDGVSKECSETDIRSALNGHFALSYASFGNDDDVIEGNQTIRQWKKQYLNGTGRNETYLTDYAGFVYDGVWVYIKALQQLIREDSTQHPYISTLDKFETIQRLTEIIKELNFQGVSGRIQFSREGSRFTDINVLQWQQKDFMLVGTYVPVIQNRTILPGELKLNSLISWFAGELPDDGSESCELNFLAQAFGTDCHKVRVFSVFFFCIIIVLVCSGSSFLFWKKRYDKKLALSEKKNYMFDKIVMGYELTKWEIPRENVVINRKLGEGAFGTVYGGEALVSEDGGWTAVAIKTLKPGSLAENRLDFLAESETMKRFDHKNIVKLLAVCLQSEPLYTIMEYMLYGDLKTYLLARRHLVNDRLNDDSDISPKRLTNMAMDVARGLSYLASMNYVHRDVACRNCMINAQRVVKIGDFGMARPTFESDYYRFVRKGMLPVRWMSPESIDGGIFSHASDIWSYGVLLYEIVSLGAFPFQGLNNSQVFEHVKQGNCIKIPAEGKAQLKALMSSCFSIDPKKRPDAATIVEFISNYQRMLTPCMDVPKPNLDDQVNLIDSDNDQLERLEHIMNENRDRSHTPAQTVNFLRTSVSSSALQTNSNHDQNLQDPSFDYLEMRLPRKPNGICLREFHPDLTASLPNGNYNPVEPLLQVGPRPEISKSNLSLMKYMPMCGGFGKNSNRSSPDECTSAM